MAGLFAVLACATPTPAADWQGRAAVGGEIGASGYGVVEGGLRTQSLTIEFLTDTLDVRLSGETDRGRWWAAGRGEFGAAGFFHAPWVDGLPAPERRLLGAYGGLEAGGVRYGPGGTWAGVSTVTRLWAFVAVPDGPAPPPSTPVVTVDGVAGVWREHGQVWVRLGVDLEGLDVAPHAHLTGAVEPRGAVVPFAHVRAGIAHNQSDITRTRAGGMSPFFVPVAGAGPAEFWVEDYAAMRAGISAGSERVRGFLATDGAVLDGLTVVGFAAGGRGEVGPWRVDASIGVAPWLSRPGGHLPASVFVRVAHDWRPLSRDRE